MGQQIISKQVAVSELAEGDVVRAAAGPAEIEGVCEMGGSFCLAYRYLESGDYHERYIAAGERATVYLEHPAIGAARR